MNLDKILGDFAKANKINEKGPLSVALVVTNHAKKLGLPLNPEDLLTDGGGQVFGLGKSSVQSILNEHGIDRVLAMEGGRTSRGSIGKMRLYVELLNRLHEEGDLDIEAVEKWWIARVKDYFSKKPFKFTLDSSKSIRSVIQDLFMQAEKRQSESPGYSIVGIMLQHLVGAKLNLILDHPPEHHGSAVSDESSGRPGDFLISDVAIHVTTSPTESLISKCKDNLDRNLKPVVITTTRGVLITEALSEQLGIGGRLDVFDAEQFLAGNLYELGKFENKGRRNTAKQIIEAYNKIVKECETDPGLAIELK